jgi:hypothetical protein
MGERGAASDERFQLGYRSAFRVRPGDYPRAENTSVINIATTVKT